MLYGVQRHVDPNTELQRRERKIEMDNNWIMELGKEKLHKLFLIDEELGSRVSDMLLRQLQLGVFDDSLHVQMVQEEIRALEGKGKTRTRPADAFKGKHLVGLHKKHFYQTSLIGRNLQNEWKLQSGKSGKLREMIRRFWKKDSDPLTVSHQIANAFVKGLAERESRGDLDGEWLIFAKWGGKNYYLALAHHKDGDEQIRSAILDICGKQFPFVKELLGVTSRE